MKLGEITDIKIGLVLSRKKASIKYEVESRYKLITLKNIEENGAFNEEQFETFESNDELDNGYFTEEGDILIRLSHPHTSVYIDKSKSGLLVPSYFAIIKLTTQKFIPEYITWYLNTDKVKKELMKSQTGTAISTTNKSILASLDIDEVPIEKQKKIWEIRELHLREIQLLYKLIEEKKKYYKTITDKLLKMD